MKAFLSHSTANKPFVEPIAAELGRQYCVPGYPNDSTGASKLWFSVIFAANHRGILPRRFSGLWLGGVIRISR